MKLLMYLALFMLAGCLDSPTIDNTDAEKTVLKAYYSESPVGVICWHVKTPNSDWEGYHCLADDGVGYMCNEQAISCIHKK